MIARKGNSVYRLLASSIGILGIGQIDSLDAGIAIGILEGYVIELNTIVYDAKHHAFASV